MRQPKVFLFDEPLSNLDAELRVQMRLELARLHRQIGATMIYVTHDQVEAMTLADKIFVLQAGVVRQAGRPLELYDDPDNRFVAGFIGSPSMNFLAGEVVGHDRDRRRRRARRHRRRAVAARLAGRAAGAGHARHARHAARAPGDRRRRRRGLPLAVEMEEDLGGVSYLHARTAAGQPIVLERRAATARLRGPRIAATVPPDTRLVFDEPDARLR